MTRWCIYSGNFLNTLRYPILTSYIIVKNNPSCTLIIFINLHSVCYVYIRSFHCGTEVGQQISNMIIKSCLKTSTEYIHRNNYL